MGKTRIKQRHKQLKDKGGWDKRRTTGKRNEQIKNPIKMQIKISISVTMTERELHIKLEFN